MWSLIYKSFLGHDRNHPLRRHSFNLETHSRISVDAYHFDKYRGTGRLLVVVNSSPTTFASNADALSPPLAFLWRNAIQRARLEPAYHSLGIRTCSCCSELLRRMVSSRKRACFAHHEVDCRSGYRSGYLQPGTNRLHAKLFKWVPLILMEWRNWGRDLTKIVATDLAKWQEWDLMTSYSTSTPRGRQGTVQIDKGGIDSEDFDRATTSHSCQRPKWQPASQRCDWCLDGIFWLFVALQHPERAAPAHRLAIDIVTWWPNSLQWHTQGRTSWPCDGKIGSLFAINEHVAEQHTSGALIPVEPTSPQGPYLSILILPRLRDPQRNTLASILFTWSQCIGSIIHSCLTIAPASRLAKKLMSRRCRCCASLKFSITGSLISHLSPYSSALAAIIMVIHRINNYPKKSMYMLLAYLELNDNISTYLVS